MAALSYLLLPISGLIAYFSGASQRVRFHGLQAILLGLLWPVTLYVASYVSPEVTFIASCIGALVWLVMLLGTAAGRDPRLPLVGRGLWDAAVTRPGGMPDERSGP